MSQSTHLSRPVLFSARALFRFLLISQMALVVLLWSFGVTWRDGRAVTMLVLALLVGTMIGEAIRRRFRFGRRVLIAGLSISVSIAAVLAWQVTRIHQHRMIVSRIEQSGGSVLYYVTDQGSLDIPKNDTAWVQVNGAYHMPVWLLNFIGKDAFASVRILDLSRSTYPDTNMDDLAHLGTVHDLHLGKRQATSVGLAKLMSLSINDLWICDSRVSTTDVDHLKTLKQLHTLVFLRSQVAPESLRDLQTELPNCQVCF